MTVRAVEHIGLTVAHLEQATTSFAEAFGAEHVHARTPWGSTVELVTYPSPQADESGTALRRRRPGPSADHTEQES